MLEKIIQTMLGFKFKRPTTILHIGANSGQEVAKYERLDLVGYHVEAIPEIFNVLNEKCKLTKNQHAINVCISDVVGKNITFNVASNGAQSSSIFPLGRHAAEYPNIKYTSVISLLSETIDHLISNKIIAFTVNFIVIDVQGAEMLVLQGSKQLLSSPDLMGLVVEVSAEPLYEGGASFMQVNAQLRESNFFLQSVNFNSHGWGDAVYLRPWWFKSIEARV